jgi:hypothetical protein
VFEEFFSMDQSRTGFVSIHTAESEAEALVIRSLLEANGIHSPGPELVNPLLLKDVGMGFQALEIYVPEAQAEAARVVIDGYLEGNTAEFRDPEGVSRPVTNIDRKPRPKIT